MAGLERRHPHLQHAIIHDLGWRSLRAVQELTIDAILDGGNAVVLAPTAGGKTEASIFPVLSRVLTENLKPVSALYVCPIRALLNNQEERLQSYARMVGTRGEKLYGKRNFFELYAVFTAPPVMRVQHGKEDVGYIQALFVTMHDASKGPLWFRLSGRAWEVGQIDWGKGVLHVRSAEHGRVPSWLGLPGVLSNALCQGMLDVLLHERQEGAWLSKVAAAELAAMRESYDGLLEEGTAPLEDHPDGVQWHTFAGGAVNRLLAAGLEQKSGKKWVAGNLSLRCKDIAFTAASYRSSGPRSRGRIGSSASRQESSSSTSRAGSARCHSMR